MAAGTISIPSKRFDELAQRLVESGRYNSPSEVLEAALDALEREECGEEAKEEWLEQALEAGFASGVAEGDVFARVCARGTGATAQLAGMIFRYSPQAESDLDDITAWSLKRFGAEQTAESNLRSSVVRSLCSSRSRISPAASLSAFWASALLSHQRRQRFLE